MNFQLGLAGFVMRKLLVVVQMHTLQGTLHLTSLMLANVWFSDCTEINVILFVLLCV